MTSTVNNSTIAFDESFIINSLESISKLRTRNGDLRDGIDIVMGDIDLNQIIMNHSEIYHNNIAIGKFITRIALHVEDVFGEV